LALITCVKTRLRTGGFGGGQVLVSSRFQLRVESKTSGFATPFIVLLVERYGPNHFDTA